jgi:pimeloyl-ACP methyl ester carboxylesterase
MSWPDARRLRYTPTTRVPSDDGTEIAVEILGDGHPGPTLVFVHGWTFSSRSYHYQRMLAERYRLVLVDHRGHGESDPGPRENRTIDQIARDLHAVIEATCADREVVLVGHSMGGMTIMALAAERPELFGTKVKGVALLNTSAGEVTDNTFGLPRPVVAAFLKQWESSLALMVSDPEKAEKAKRAGTAPSRLISRWLNFGRKPDKRLVAFTEAMSSQTKAEVVGDFYLSLQTHDKLAALAALGAVPTLIVAGERDRLLPPEHSRRMAAAIPHARLLELDGAGHCPMLEQPDAVNAALYDLVRAVEEKASLPATKPTESAQPRPSARRSSKQNGKQKVAS